MQKHIKLIEWASLIDTKKFNSQRKTLNDFIVDFLDHNHPDDIKIMNRLAGLQNMLDSLYDILNPPK